MPSIKSSILHPDLKSDRDLMVKLNNSLGSFLNMSLLPSHYPLPADGPLPGGDWDDDIDRSKFKLFYLNDKDLYISTTYGNRDLTVAHTHGDNNYCRSLEIIEAPVRYTPRTTMNEIISDALRTLIAMRTINHPEWMLDDDMSPLQAHTLNIPPEVIIKEVIVDKEITVVDKSANFRDLALSLASAAIASSLTPLKEKVNKYVIRNK